MQLPLIGRRVCRVSKPVFGYTHGWASNDNDPIPFEVSECYRDSVLIPRTHPLSQLLGFGGVGDIEEILLREFEVKTW